MTDTDTTTEPSATTIRHGAEQIAVAADKWRRDLRTEPEARSCDVAGYGLTASLAQEVARLAAIVGAQSLRRSDRADVVAIRYRAHGGPWQYLDAADPAVDAIPRTTEQEALYR